MSWDNSLKQRSKSREEKFWEKVNIKSDAECWEWKASKNKKGYGNFYLSIGHSEDKHTLAHRMAYMLANKIDEIPKGMCVLHHCDNPACVNPKHLFLGTNYDNVQDRVAKGREADRRGEKSPKSKLKNEDIYEIRNLRNQGWTLFAIADKFHVHYSTIGYILKGKLWHHI